MIDKEVNLSGSAPVRIFDVGEQPCECVAPVRPKAQHSISRAQLGLEGVAGRD